MESVLVSAGPPGLGDAEVAAVVAVLGAAVVVPAAAAGAAVVEPAAVEAAVVPVGAVVVAVVGAKVVANIFGKIPPPGKKSLATRP